MDAPSGFERAYLQIEGESGKLECWFNPSQYEIKNTNKWEVKPVVGAGLPTAQFGGGNARELNLDLLFDDSDGAHGDVRTITNRLFKLMEVNQAFASGANKGRPPMIEFGWGSMSTFKAVATSLSVSYTLFKPNGTPVRAQAKIALLQVEKATGQSGGKTKRQNPTTTGLAGVRSHIVRDGDSLQSIAYAAYGDPTQWRSIAHANGPRH